MRLVSTKIWVTFDMVGFHRYPDAPDAVAYLRDRHRHVFKFKVAVSVIHHDRDIEFHMFKMWLTGLYEDKTLEVDYKSCEMLASELLVKIDYQYGLIKDCVTRRYISVEVSEDGECGAVVSTVEGLT